MTASSEYGRFTGWADTILAADDPVDTGLVRDGVVNSLLHGYDQAFQTRCNWSARAAAQATAFPTLSTATWRALPHALGTFPVTLRADGTSPILVVRLGLVRSVGSGTVRVRVAWRADDATPFGRRVPPAIGDLNAAEFSLSGTSAGAWVGSASLTLSSLLRSTLPTTRASDSAAGSSEVVLTRIDAFAKLDSGASGTPSVCAFLAREYVG